MDKNELGHGEDGFPSALDHLTWTERGPSLDDSEFLHPKDRIGRGVKNEIFLNG